MAISGSSNYSITRDNLIAHAYRILGALRAGGTPSADEITDATEALNIMVKAWQAYGLQLWVIKQATLIPTNSGLTYKLGDSATDDHSSLDMGKTEMRIAGVLNDTILEVDSTTGMVALDNIGIVLDDGTIQWTTIVSVTDSDTLVITTGLTSAAAIDNHIYFYTNKIVRPHELLELYRRDYDNVVDVPLIRLSRTDFFTLSDKDTLGTPVNYYYDPQLTSSVLHVWPTAGNIFTSNSVFIANIKKPFDDLDNASDDFEFPQEWFEALVYGLAERIAPMIGYPLQDRQILKMESAQALDLALSFDHEQTDVTFVSNENQKRNLFGS
jgi:hypothetical protein